MGLAVERHHFQGDLLGIRRRTPGTRQVSGIICPGTAANPSANRIHGAIHKDPDRLLLHADLMFDQRRNLLCPYGLYLTWLWL